MNKDLIAYLTQFMTPERLERMNTVLNARTRYTTVVLENIFQSQNASAVLRTCECLGIQDVHIIENTNKFNLNPDVVRGSSNWLTIHKYNKRSNDNTVSAIDALKNQGYRIIATTPHKDECSPAGFDLSKGKAAFVFGTEMQGISKAVMERADEFMKIPMYGFTESFNISVTVAIAMNHIVEKLRRSDISWQLEPEEKDQLLSGWMEQSIQSGDMLVKHFYEKIAGSR